MVGQSGVFRAGSKAHKEPKSMLGILIMSSVSTPNDPSNAGAPGVLCSLRLDGAYILGQSSQ
jgi:hypothetical protein